MLPDSAPVVRLDRVSKRFGSLRVLNEVSLTIGQGVTGLLGPNGAGKSTLIKIVLGLLRASSGSGHVLGLKLGRESRAIRRRVGFMPEDDCYLPALSGVECVQFGARLCGFSATESMRRAHEILDFCGAGQERYRPVETYSTGMRQKLKFAQALVHDPPLLILDEPTAGLDPDERDAMLERIKALAHEHKKTVVLCTHILHDVQTVSDYVAILSAGELRIADRLDALSRPASPSIEVRTVGSATALLDVLKARGLEAELTPEGRILANGAGESSAAALWDAARQSQSLIQRIEPARTSLETIFLDAVRGSADGN